MTNAANYNKNNNNNNNNYNYNYYYTCLTASFPGQPG